MIDFKGKTAVITGGAEGIGFSIAQALAERGANLVLCDIDETQLAQACEELSAQGVTVMSKVMDVTHFDDWEALAQMLQQDAGDIHMIVNNAGVGSAPGKIEQTRHEDWRWVMDVNLMGVVYGMQTIIPLIKQHGNGGYVVNVGSMAGMGGVPFAGPYTASKLAVVGMSESWHMELKPDNIHVSVLCPGFVQTRIAESHRNRQPHYSKTSSANAIRSATGADAKHMSDIVNAGIDARVVGLRVLEALEMGELYIFTHPSYRKIVARRSKALDDAFARAAHSPLLKDLEEPEHISGFKQ